MQIRWHNFISYFSPAGGLPLPSLAFCHYQKVKFCQPPPFTPRAVTHSITCQNRWHSSGRMCQGWLKSFRQRATKLKEFDLVGRCRSDGISFPSASSLIRLVAYVAEMSISGTTVHPPQIGRNSRMGNDSKWYLSISMSQIKDLTLGWVGIYRIRGHTTTMAAHFSKKWGDFCGVDVEEPHKHT